MKWFEILKNIQISGQRTSSRDYVLPDEDDDTCRERFNKMMDFIDTNWEGSVDNDLEETNLWPEEVFCKALEAINKHSFLFYNPIHEGNPETKWTDLYKFRDAFNFYRFMSFKEDFTLMLGNGFALRMGYRMVAPRANVINIFCNVVIGNDNLITFAGFQISQTFNVTGDEFAALLAEEPYDDGVEIVGIPRDIEPSYIKNKDWRKF